MTRNCSNTSRSLLRLLALLLAAAMLLCGCAGGGQSATSPDKPDAVTPEEPDTPDTPDDPGTPDTPDTPDVPDTPDTPDDPEAIYTVGEYELTTFGKMPYERPDMTALELLFNDTADFADAATAQDSVELNKKLSLCWDAYNEYYTMEALAMLRSDIDQTDEFYAGEYDFFLTNDVYVEEWLDTTLIACACSKAYVLSSQLAGYTAEDSEPYTDRALELMAQEGVLLRDYWQVMMLDEIEIDGRVQSYSDYISSPYITIEAYRAANLAYYRACNQQAAPIYIELIKVRRALAEELGYDSYEDYQYETFGRDYTPEQVRTYLDSVADEVSGYYRDFMAADPYDYIYYPPLSSSRLLTLLEQTTAHMGDDVTDAYDFMKEYHLYDVKASSIKAPGAYTIYLSSYEAPFCYVGAYGDVEDFLDLSHEFGHFCDAYVNSNATASLDLAETYSQAMANLTLLKSKDVLSGDSYRNLLLMHLLANLDLFAQQTAYADFERRVYALPDEELTVENVNALALECAHRFGSAPSPEDDAIYAVYWSQVTHLFEQPYYVISYCVSADAAIQIAEKELNEPGAGVACYGKLLDWRDGDFLSELERVGLVSPFEPGRAEHNLALVESLVESELGGYMDAA